MGRAGWTLPYKYGIPGAIRPAPISWTREQILDMHPYPWNTDTVRIPVRPEVLRSFGITSPDTVLELEVKPVSPQYPSLSANAAQILDIVETNQWRRPIYFSEPTQLACIDNCLQDCGLVSRLVPVNAASHGLERDTATIKRVLLDPASYRDLPTLKDHDMPRASGIVFAYQVGLVKLAMYYDSIGDSVARNKVLDQMSALIPDSIYPMKPAFAQYVEQLRKGLKPSAGSSVGDTITLNRLTGHPTLLPQGDKSADGKESFINCEGARTFEAPDSGKWYIVGLSIHGRRLGPAESSQDMFDITLSDSVFGTVAAWRRPYSAFAEDSNRWVRFSVTPTRVPRQFSVVLDFHSTREKGVDVSYDSSTHGHSIYIVPGCRDFQFGSGDWMIRVELDQSRQ
jgi:hypothetical protein